jgi:DNA-binding response OmpR family regulator
MPQASVVGTRNVGVLVADDEPGIRSVLEMGMRQAGFDVWLASDGLEAIEVYQNNRQGIDVVLLDVRMPILDGVQTLTALRALAPGIPCCFISGHLGVYTEADLQNAGAARILPKPFVLDEVKQAVSELARRAS